MTGRRPPPTTRELRQQSLLRRGLGRREAAIYLGIGEKLFSRLVRMGRAPQPKVISTGRSTVERWDVLQLDQFIDQLPSRGESGRMPAAPTRRVITL